MNTVTSKSWSHEDGVVPVAPTSWQHILTTLRRHCSNAAPSQAVADDFTPEGLPHLSPSPTLAPDHQHPLPAMCLAASAVPAPMLRATTRPRRFQANQRRGLEETNYGGEANRCSDWSLASNEM
jgi:hypothetical protein